MASRLERIACAQRRARSPASRCGAPKAWRNSRYDEATFVVTPRASWDWKRRAPRPSLREAMATDGAVRVVWPKGQTALREDDVRRAARAMGLVDVKVMSVSETLSGLKLIIPVAQRG